MKTQNNIMIKVASSLLVLLIATPAAAQSKAYSRKKAASAADQSKSSGPATGAATGSSTPIASASASTAATAAQPGKDSEKLDIQELEQKYWAPKDTDFSVVQNRTYSKSKRKALSVMTGPIVNDPFNSGLTTAISANYYFDERYGVELMYQSSDLTDSDATKDFRKFSLGGVRPDFNRDISFYGIGFNYVPFYAKMSFMGKKIIYFDMQITPFIGMSTYEQLTDSKDPEETSFTYGFDVTQYFFFHKNWAVRANLHNRYYKADIRSYQNNSVVRSGESQNTTLFLMGLTYFF